VDESLQSWSSLIPMSPALASAKTPLASSPESTMFRVWSPEVRMAPNVIPPRSMSENSTDGNGSMSTMSTIPSPSVSEAIMVTMKLSVWELDTVSLAIQVTGREPTGSDVPGYGVHTTSVVISLPVGELIWRKNTSRSRSS